MSAERIKGKVAFSCDTRGCDSSVETDHGDFKEAAAAAKDEGWLFRKREESWKHYCCEIHEEMDYRGQSVDQSVVGKK